MDKLLKTLEKEVTIRLIDEIRSLDMSFVHVEDNAKEIMTNFVVKLKADSMLSLRNLINDLEWYTIDNACELWLKLVTLNCLRKNKYLPEEYREIVDLKFNHMCDIYDELMLNLDIDYLFSDMTNTL